MIIKRRGYIFDWTGGPYIEIARAEQPDKPFEVIHVGGKQPAHRAKLERLINAWQGGFDSPAQAFRHLDNVAHNTLDY